MGEIYGKKIFIIVEFINSNLTKICFCKLYIRIKIIQNLSNKLKSKVTIKLNWVSIDF